jgi:hypothetical protein
MDENKISEIAEEAATLPPADIGIREEIINKAATKVEEALREVGLDPNRMTDLELSRFLLGFFKELGGLSNVMSDELLDKSAIVLAKELENIEPNRSGYRHGYAKSNRSFSSIRNYSKIKTAMIMIPFALSNYFGGKLKAAELVSRAANNPTAVEMAVEKTILENITPKDSIIRYRKDVKPEKSLIETIKPALEEIKKAGGTSLYEKYNRFVAAQILTPLPEKDTLDPETRIAFRLYKSAKIIYNKFRGRNKVSLDTLLSDEKTEMATRHIVFAAISYNILDQLDYKAHDLNPDQAKQLRQELREGKYEVKLKDNTIVINTENDTLDLEFILTPHEIQVMGIPQAQSILENSEYRNILLNNLTAYKSTIAPVENAPLYDIYVVLPVLVQEGTMNPAHEVAFRIRCSLELNSYVNAHSQFSHVRPILNRSQVRKKNNRLFGKKKKYEWM